MTPRGAKRHAAPTRRSEIQTLRQVSRELFAPLSHPGKETPTHEGARAFSPLSLFLVGEGFDFLGSAPAREQGFWAPSRVWVCRRSEPEARPCGRAEALFCLRRAGQARVARAGPGAIGAHAACVAARRSAIVAPFGLLVFWGKDSKKR